MLHASAVSAIYDYEDGITLSFREFLFSKPEGRSWVCQSAGQKYVDREEIPCFYQIALMEFGLAASGPACSALAPRQPHQNCPCT